MSDDADKVLYSRRLPNNLAEICSALTPYQADLFGVVVESTYNWYWLVCIGQLLDVVTGKSAAGLLSHAGFD
ncbi:MAG TPA: hypothetical protein VGM52_13090 [Herbaspirillum sp.]